MAHFAEINNGTVIRVLVVPDEQEHRGQEYLAQDCKLGGIWIQTSYNTRAGKHKNEKPPLRKNYAGIGFTYDPVRDAFIPPKKYQSWVLDEETCLWNPPVPYPTTPPEIGKKYIWDESTISWIQIPRQ